MLMTMYDPAARTRAGTLNGTLMLVLGILSIVVCGILGPFAWVMGDNALAALDRGEGDPNERGTVTAGRICGIIGTVFLILGILMVIAYLVIVFLFIGVAATQAPRR